MKHVLEIIVKRVLEIIDIYIQDYWHHEATLLAFLQLNPVRNTKQANEKKIITESRLKNDKIKKNKTKQYKIIEITFCT